MVVVILLLPPLQIVCCPLTDVQEKIYRHLLSSKEIRHILDGKQTNILCYIGTLQKLCNHPYLLQEPQQGSSTRKGSSGGGGGSKTHGMDAISQFLPPEEGGQIRGRTRPVRPELSGKMMVSG